MIGWNVLVVNPFYQAGRKAVSGDEAEPRLNGPAGTGHCFPFPDRGRGGGRKE